MKYHGVTIPIPHPTPHSLGDHHGRLLRGRGLDRCRLRQRRVQLVQRRFPIGVRRPQPDHAQHGRGHQLQHYAHPLLYTGRCPREGERCVWVWLFLLTIYMSRIRKAILLFM